MKKNKFCMIFALDFCYIQAALTLYEECFIKQHTTLFYRTQTTPCIATRYFKCGFRLSILQHFST